MMKRNEFIKHCGLACAGLLIVPALLESCTPVKYVESGKENNRLRVSRSEFATTNKDKALRYVIVKSAGLQLPIVLYRFSETAFAAFLLQCPHQGAELSVSGNLISCAAHGSEFNNKGEVITGPADQNLKNYRVSTDSDNIYIQLL
jgi:Rieske Fe-S protein